MAERTTMNVSLPESLREWVDEQVEKGGFGSASEYVRHVLREERKRVAQERLEEMLMEGVESGPAAEMTPEDWDEIREEVRKRLDQRRKKTG